MQHSAFCEPAIAARGAGGGDPPGVARIPAGYGAVESGPHVVSAAVQTTGFVAIAAGVHDGIDIGALSDHGHAPVQDLPNIVAPFSSIDGASAGANGGDEVVQDIDSVILLGGESAAPSGGGGAELGDNPGGPPTWPAFAEFREAVTSYIAGRHNQALFAAELMLLQLARRRDLSSLTCDDIMKTITNPAFASAAYTLHGQGAASELPTSWRAIMDIARKLLTFLDRFLPKIEVYELEVRTGPGGDAHVHRGRVAALVGNQVVAFMLLDTELYAKDKLVRPVRFAGESAWRGAHPSWMSNTSVGGASHPSFAPLLLAREATVCDAYSPLAYPHHTTLPRVPVGLVFGIDGTGGGKKLGRTPLTPVYLRLAWLPYARLHHERAYTTVALLKTRKLPSAAAQDKVASPGLRSALIQEGLLVALCLKGRLQPFVTTLPGERQPALVCPYLAFMVLDHGEVLQVCACGNKGCSMCTCAYADLGGPVTLGHCAGGGTFRDGAECAAWVATRAAAGTTFAANTPAEEKRYRSRPIRVGHV